MSEGFETKVRSVLNRHWDKAMGWQGVGEMPTNEALSAITALYNEDLLMLQTEHCKDCCCARSWKALGVNGYTGKSIPEHIADLQRTLKKIVKAWDAWVKEEPESLQYPTPSDAVPLSILIKAINEADALATKESPLGGVERGRDGTVS